MENSVHQQQQQAYKNATGITGRIYCQLYLLWLKKIAASWPDETAVFSYNKQIC
jgi:hypothetical protein